ncbi:unnamed protein product [Coregonus sp. 'balchen']|nr:unnamed protein product [Coregonus sp. 'balchen']
MKDLESFKVTVTDAWTIPLGEYQMHFPPPPSGGAILSFILNIMKACKLSNGLRKYIRDPHFNSGTHDALYYNVTPYLDPPGSRHVSVVAEDGTAVSVTSAINHM